MATTRKRRQSPEKRKEMKTARTLVSATEAPSSRRGATPGSTQTLKEFLEDALKIALKFVEGADQTNEAVKTTLKDIPSEKQALPDFLCSLLDVQLHGFSPFDGTIFMLNLVKCLRDSQGRRDSLIETAVQELPKFAFAKIWTTIDNDELPPSDPQTVKNHNRESGGAEALLEFVWRNCVPLEDESAESKVCAKFIESLPGCRQPELFGRLLRTCAFHLIRSSLDIDECEKYTKSLQLLLRKDLVSFSELLEQEEAGCNNKEARFFQCRDVGSLLSVSFIPTIDEETHRPILPFHDSSLAKIVSATHSHKETLDQFNSKIKSMALTTEKIQKLFSSVFRELLKNPEVHTTVLYWIAAALNKNWITLTDADSHFAVDQNTCEPRFLMNLCCVMLECVNVFHVEYELPATLDLGYFSSSVCKVDSLYLINLAGDPIRQKSSVSDSQFAAETECFCLCLLAVHLGVLNTMRLALNWKESQKNRSLFSTETDGPPPRDIIVTALMDTAVRNELLCQRVNKMYLILCESLLKLLETPTKPKQANLENTELDLSDVPRFCITGMTNWISGLEHLKIEVKKFEPASFAKVAMKILLNSGTKLSCLLRFQLIETVVTCVRKSSKKQVRKIRLSDVKKLRGVLVETFVDMSAWEGVQVFSGTFNTCLARAVIVDLLLRSSQEELGRALVATHTPDFFLVFLSAVLKMTILQRQGDFEEIEQKANQGKQTVFHLLCLLVEEEDVAVMLTRPPLAMQCAVAVTCICECLLLKSAVKNDSVSDLFLKLAAVDTEEEGGFLWSLADCHEFLHRVLCYAMMSESSLHKDKLCALTKQLKRIHEQLRVKREQEQSSLLDQTLDEDAPTRLFQDKISQARVITASLVQSHSFRAVLEPYKAASRKTETLKREMEHLQTELSSLPDKAIFVVRDSERYDVLRCVVSGPVDTPYSGGLFVFDVYCPDYYPRVPPLVRFLTTGYGTADFHACLHVNGEVFLNLLGTDCDADGSGPWNADKSTLLDVLESIQSAIFEERPLFSYRCKQPREKSQQVEVESQQHNRQLQLLTVRYAMLEQVRNPPAGLEGIIRQYFSIQLPALVEMYRYLMEKPPKDPIDFHLKWVMTALLSKLRILKKEEENV